MRKDKKVIIEVQGAAIINMGLAQGERLQKLNAIAIRQLRSLTSNVALRTLGIAGTEGEA